MDARDNLPLLMRGWTAFRLVKGGKRTFLSLSDSELPQEHPIKVTDFLSVSTNFREPVIT